MTTFQNPNSCLTIVLYQPSSTSFQRIFQTHQAIIRDIRASSVSPTATCLPIKDQDVTQHLHEPTASSAWARYRHDITRGAHSSYLNSSKNDMDNTGQNRTPSIRNQRGNSSRNRIEERLNQLFNLAKTRNSPE
jgi:hypothetical protein